MSNNVIESIIRRHCSIFSCPHLKNDIANYFTVFFFISLYALSLFFFIYFALSYFLSSVRADACYRESTMSCVIDVIDEPGWDGDFASSWLSKQNICPTAAGNPVFGYFCNAGRKIVTSDNVSSNFHKITRYIVTCNNWKDYKNSNYNKLFLNWKLHEFSYFKWDCVLIEYPVIALW